MRLQARKTGGVARIVRRSKTVEDGQVLLSTEEQT
jgi:DNA-directed RNA polymerase subunit H (RpoH/RPB5)